jgi:hypothetical protein
MHRFQAIHLPLLPSRETIPSHAQVCKLGISAKVRQGDRREHRVFGARLLKRTVAVPKLIGNIAHNLGMLAIGYLAIHFHIGNVGQLSVLQTVRTALEFAQAHV